MRHVAVPAAALALVPALIVLVFGAGSPAARAAEPEAPAAASARLPPVVVTATRTAELPADVPASISRIDGSEVRDGHPLVNLSESLGAVPGLQARDRQNYAQDLQISVRGFGARSSFGIRGVRLYVDGIPATLPDGQGQISNVELGSVDRIEVLRGPASALYGNSSGGVVQIFTAEGEGRPSVGFGGFVGSDRSFRLGAQAQGALGSFGYNVSTSRFRTDGYRDHSAADRRLGNAKLTFGSAADTKLTIVANALSLPEALDPMGLTRAQADANPRGVDPSAVDYDTRKSVDQTQLGAILEHRLDPANAVRLLVYAGHRGTQQFQSIPKATQASPLSPGGVISLDRDYEGADLRWSWKGGPAGAPLTLIGGLAYDQLTEHRQGFQNFVGNTLGVLGALRRDELNEVTSVDPYLQAGWKFAPRWTLDLGLRRSRIAFRSTDAYIVGSNPDDSGKVSYGALLPAAGLMVAATEALHLYVSAGRGFETPTLNELAYRSGGETGLNLGLRASTSRSLEAGIKADLGALGLAGEATVAVFRTGTANEIVTQTNVSGRSTYQNAGATRRTGVELGWSASWRESLRAQLAATLLNANYQDAFLSCTASPCATPNVAVAAGNRIPGLARGSAYASLNWAPPTGLRAGIEARYVGSVIVNDANTDAAGRYAVVAGTLGYGARVGPVELTAFIRADNLLDRRYLGSVIVNEGNGRYFEPAPGRTWLASMAATVRF